MGTNTLNTLTGAHVIINDDFNQFTTALSGDFVGRDPSTKAPSDQERLGTPTVPWDQLHVTNMFLNGALFDPENIGTGSSKNAVNSGRTRTDSGQPDFIRASGSGASATILATDADLKYTANNVGVILDADVSLTSLTTAPGTNNTCLVNNTALAGALSTKYEGEGLGGTIAVDNAGSEITDRVRQYICLKHGTDEYMLAFVNEADSGAGTAALTNIFRGFFFDSSGNPLTREVMSDNDTLTLMSLGWVFGQNNGTTFDVSYKSPIWSFNEPASPATDDYWYDLQNDIWKRYDGADFVIVNRTLLGWVVIDGTNCVASRSLDFSKAFSDEGRFTVDGVPLSVTQIQSKSKTSFLSVYANTIRFDKTPVIWDITTDLETGLIEADQVYYLYLTQDGDTVISDERPYDRRNDLKGYYHPYHSWRAVGTALNSAGDLVSANTTYVTSDAQFTRYVDFTASGTFIPGQYDIINNQVLVEVWGGGGGGGSATGTTARTGGGAGGYAKGIADISGVSTVTITIGAGGSGGSPGNNGNNGGASSFGSFLTTTGGTGGNRTTAIVNSGRGTKGDYLGQGANGERSSSSTADVAGGLGQGGEGGGSLTTSRIGEGGTTRQNTTGTNGFRGHVRIWY